MVTQSEVPPFANLQPASVVPNAAAVEAVVMGKPRVKPSYRHRVLLLPDLDRCKTIFRLSHLGRQTAPVRQKENSQSADGLWSWLARFGKDMVVDCTGGWLLNYARSANKPIRIASAITTNKVSAPR